jgi:hypothetical protein
MSDVPTGGPVPPPRGPATNRGGPTTCLGPRPSPWRWSPSLGRGIAGCTTSSPSSRSCSSASPLGATPRWTWDAETPRPSPWRALQQMTRGNGGERRRSPPYANAAPATTAAITPRRGSSAWPCAYAERWVRSIKDECLSRLIVFGEKALCDALQEYIEHYHQKRNHQGRGNILLFPLPSQDRAHEGPLQCRQRLGGLLKYYPRPHEFLTSRVASWGQPLPHCPKGTSPIREVATADTRGLRPLPMPRNPPGGGRRACSPPATHRQGASSAYEGPQDRCRVSRELDQTERLRRRT